ncbi:MAG: hypothetical protein QOI35_1698, partial [Cryptosporangiaceae bacterium]|nr:hypothetical protein [Cryptosporangiaceae bacterium]
MNPETNTMLADDGSDGSYGSTGPYDSRLLH